MAQQKLSSEYDIAQDIVRPYLEKELKWPAKLISPYGRVPVELGTQTVWADFVCYVYKDQKFVPWLLVEVKRKKDDIDMDAIAQAESYSLILDCPFFCVTEGKEYSYFMAGAGQGRRTRIELPPFPDRQYLQRGLEDATFSADIDPIIESFVSAHLNSKAFRSDTENHENSSKEIRRQIFEKDIDTLTKEDIRQALDELMGKEINKDAVLQNDLRKIRAFIRFIKDFPRHGDPLVGINRLIRNGAEDDSLHIDGAGLFFVTQLLAAAHPKEYVVLEKNVAEGLRDLNITSIFVQPNTANGYLFINDVCKKLYREKIQPALKKAGLNYGHWAAHNFLWHYNAYYKATKRSWTEKA